MGCTTLLYSRPFRQTLEHTLAYLSRLSRSTLMSTSAVPLSGAKRTSVRQLIRYGGPTQHVTFALQLGQLIRSFGPVTQSVGRTPDQRMRPAQPAQARPPVR